ncbi:MAG: alpha/beta hydrolase [Lachnospiraceae bacterium]
MASEKSHQGLMQLIKMAHGFIENTDLEKHRHSQDQMGPLFASSKDMLISDVDIDGMHGEWVCVNRAHMKKYVILYCHGGGYSTGSSLYARTLTTKLAASTSMDVLSFDYRLAPEHPYPAALEDALKAWNHLMQYGYGARDVLVAGDSAGGNLALALTLKLKEQARLLPKGLLLMSPWTDLAGSGKSYLSKKDVDPVLNAGYLDAMKENYLGAQNTQETWADPFVSPLYGDFEDFPPTYIQVGDQEILRSDSVLLYKKMNKAGVNVKIDIYKGMWHVFQMSPLKTAYDAMEKNAEFIFSLCR